jgi:hypothetical protein
MSGNERPSLLAMVSATTPVVVAVIGAWFTNIYKENETEANRIAADRLELERQQRLLIDKAAVIKQYFDYLANKADSNQQRAALAVLASLGYSDLVIRVVATDPTPSNVQTLGIIASTGNKDETNSAVNALESLRASNAVEISDAAERALTNAQSATNGSATQTAIVAGADRTMEAAQTEVQRLKDAGVPNAQIIKKDDWYRTVVPIAKPEQRQQALANVQQRIRRSAYTVDLNRWCDKSAGGNCETTEAEAGK